MCHINMNLCVSVIIFGVLLSSSSAYNVDIVNYVKHKGQDRSMFGFSVASHRERGSSWVLVGAPEAQTGLSRVERGGTVFKCGTEDDGYCQEIPFDAKDDNTDSKGQKIDSKAYQWFGATLNAPVGDDSPIVACAPRYVWFANKRDRKDPVGTCYVANDGKFSEYSPCRTNLFGYHRQGSCQAGFSAAISKDGRRLFVGAPGSWYWQGQLYSIDSHATFPYTPAKFGEGSFGKGQVIQQSLETRPAVVSTVEGPATDDDSYMGYSVTVGYFFNPSTGARAEQDMAVGMPRSTSLEGKVILWTWNLTMHRNYTGEQLGAYFGYSLAAVDVDGDGWDEVVIGAPMHTEVNNEGRYEVGRVYVVWTNPLILKERKSIVLDGFRSKSRFGLSLASLGDINLDGYGDFAVGAPYDGLRERGAVYIFHGHKDGVREKFSQVIFAEDITSPLEVPVNTFGFSISGGMDLDNNNYPDMVVGAYLSDTAFFFRSRPVVKMESQVHFMTSGRHITLDEKNCTLSNRQAVPCTTLDICFMYKGIGVPQSLSLDVQIILDARKTKDPRMFFLDNESKNVLNETWNLQYGSRYCGIPKTVYIKNEIRDKLTQLEAEVRYSMRGDSRVYQVQQQQRTRNPRSTLQPILDLNNAPVEKDVISIKKNCGSDNICVPNLRLIAKPNVERYLLGSNEKLEIDVIIQNEGEDSFESTFNLQIPSGVDFKKISENNNTEVRVLCSSAPNNTIRCDIGNPLPARKIAKFKVQLKPYHQEGMRPSYDFIMSVNSTNPENPSTLSDNTETMSIHIWVDSKLELQGTSKPSDIYYNSSINITDVIKKESDIGPQVIHVYSIRNNGPSNINEAELLFIWPYETESGEELFYLLEEPAVIGDVKCYAETGYHANYKKYELEFRKKSIWESIGIDVAKGDFSMAASQTGEESKATSSSSSSSGGSRGGSVEKHFTSGDGSFVHEQRSKEQHHHVGGGGGGGGYSSGGSSGGSYSSGGSSGGSYSSGGSSGGSYSSGGRSGGSYSAGGSDGGGLSTTSVGSGGGRGSSSDGDGRFSSWNRTTTYNGPVTTHTYTKNYTTFIGPDGKVTYQETRGGDGSATSGSSSGSSGSSSGSSWSSSSSSQGSSQGSSSQGASSGSSYDKSSTGGGSYGSRGGGSAFSSGRTGSGRTNIVYTTSGSQQGQETSRHGDGDITFGPQLGGGSTGFSSASGRLDQNSGGVLHEENKSGQNLTGTQGGSTTYISGEYPRRNFTTSKNFDWNNRHRTSSGGGGGSDATSYNRQDTYHTQYGGGAGGQQQHSRGNSRIDGAGGQGGQSQYDYTQQQHRHYQSRTNEDGQYGGQQHGGGQHGGGVATQSGGGVAVAGGDTSVSGDDEYYNSREGLNIYEDSYTSEVYTGENPERNRNSQSGAGGGAASVGGGSISMGEESVRTDGGRSRQQGRNRSTYGQYDNSGRNYNDDVAKYGIGAAALGHGFKTTGVDLGILGTAGGSSSIDGSAAGASSSSGAANTHWSETSGQESSQHRGHHNQLGLTDGDETRTQHWDENTRRAYEEQKRRQQSESSGGQQSWSSSSGGGGTGGGGGGGGNTGRSNQWGDGSTGGRNQWSTNSQWSSSSQGGGGGHGGEEVIGRDNVATDKPDLNNRYVGRRKRQATAGSYEDVDISEVMQCKSTRCLKMRCTVGPMKKDQDAIVALRLRLNIRTLKSISTSQSISLSTMMLARITKLPYIGKPLDSQIHSHEIFTTVQAPEPDIKPDIVPLWVVVLSAVAGTLILLLLILLLYKCGFFKRNRPSEQPERQPLNRNGHYQNGDEAL